MDPKVIEVLGLHRRKNGKSCPQCGGNTKNQCELIKTEILSASKDV